LTTKLSFLFVQLVSKISNLYVISVHQRHRQTDRRTDGQHAITRPRFALKCIDGKIDLYRGMRYFSDDTPNFCFFTAQCTLVQSAVLRSHAIACDRNPPTSVTSVDCDHIGSKSWKLIARTISETPSLFVATRRSTYSQGNMGKF